MGDGGGLLGWVFVARSVAGAWCGWVSTGVVLAVQWIMVCLKGLHV